MQQFPHNFSSRLREHRDQNAPRHTGTGGTLVDFISNDYLGFAQDADLFADAQTLLAERGVTVNGSTGPRTVTGSHALFEEAEALVAQHHDAESALIFNSGYEAQVSFFSCVPQKGDIILYDEYLHTAARDGIRLSGAASFKFPHNNAEALYRLVERHRSKAAELYIITESVFWLDGDTPNLLAYADMARRYKCRLVVDEAHAVGVFGERGEGLATTHITANDIFARFVSFGKALGCQGAAVLGSAQLHSYLMHFAPALNYSTALPPQAVAAVICAYKKLAVQDALLETLHNTIMHFKWETERLRLTRFILSFSTIHSIVLGNRAYTLRLAQKLQDEGYAVMPITTTPGQERLRFSVHTFNTRGQITHVLELLNAFILSS